MNKELFVRYFVWGILCIGLMSGAVLAAAGDVHTFELTWEASGFHKNLHAAMDRSEPFDAEPDTGDRDVFRGVVHCGDLSNDDTPDVGFLWDKSEGKLYVDLNRDGDLTNDPEGVLTTEDKGSGQYINQQFPQFQLTLTTDTGQHLYNIMTHLSSYSDRQGASFFIRSGYMGTVNLQGVGWMILVNDSLKGRVDSGNQMSVRIDEGEFTNSCFSLAVPRSIFLHDHCYAIDFEFKTGDDNAPRLWCTLTEKEVPLAELKLQSQGVHQLVFGNGDTLVLPRLSDDVFTVPVGEYRCRELTLKPQEHLSAASPQNLHSIVVSVAADTENVLTVGSPLNHTVEVERAGRVLKFNYQLVGQGGETYDLREITGYDNDKSPKIAIYKGDMQLASGQFEYG